MKIYTHKKWKNVDNQKNIYSLSYISLKLTIYPYYATVGMFNKDKNKKIKNTKISSSFRFDHILLRFNTE